MNATKEPLNFAPDYAAPPGQLVQEHLETLGISARELARRCGRSAKLITEIIQGKAPIEPETAMQFERVLGLDASIWLGLEADFRLHKARATEEGKLAEHSSWARLFPLKALYERGFIPRAAGGAEQVRSILRFFGVGSVDACKARCSDLLDADYRTSPTYTSRSEPLAAWLQIGEMSASEIVTKPYDRNAFVNALKNIRPLTSCPIEDAVPSIRAFCAEAGVAFVLEPPFEKVVVSGVSKWLSPKKALIQQSLRYRRDDHFWFTFFHEAAHLLLHSRKAVFIDEQKGSGNAIPELEEEANDWASEFLISQAALMRFMTYFKDNRTEEAVITFAREHGISPGIVVGQLQHRGAIGFNQMNALRTRYDWCEF